MSEKLNDKLRVFVVPVDILDVPDLTIYEKMAYMVLRSFANPRDASAFPSYATIAKLGSMSRSSAIRAVQSLIDKGLLTKETRFAVTKDRKIRNTSNMYHIEAPVKEGGVSQTLGGSVSQEPGVVSEGNQGSVRETPDHNHLTKSVIKDKKDDDKESIISLSFQKIAKEKELPVERYQEVLQRILQNKDGIVNVADYITSAVENELVKIKTKHRNTPGRTESRQHSPKQVEAIPELIKQQLERQKAVEKPKEGRSKEDIRKNVEAMLKEEAEFEKKQKRFEQLKAMMGENK